MTIIKSVIFPEGAATQFLHSIFKDHPQGPAHYFTKKMIILSIQKVFITQLIWVTIITRLANGVNDRARLYQR